MAFEPNYDVIKTNERSWLCQSQAVVEAKLIPAPGVSIAKVLSVEAESVVFVAEVFTGEARYNGKVNFTVLFLDEEGCKHCLDYTAEFTDKIACDGIAGDLNPVLVSKVLDIDVLSVSASEIKPACVVEITLIADKEKGFKCLSEAPEGVYCKQNYAEYLCLSGRGKHAFTVEASLNDCPISKVLKCNSVVCVKKSTTLSDCVKIEGEVITSMVGETANGELIQIRKAFPFSEEYEAVDARATDEAVVCARVIGSSVRLISEDGSLTAEFTVECEVDYSIYATGASNLICDLFHPDFELIKNVECKSVTCGVLESCFCDCLPGNLKLDDGSLMVDEVVCTDGFRVNVTNAKIENGKMNAEGIICGNIVYKNSEQNEIGSVSVSIPFAVDENSRLFGADDVKVMAVVTGVTVKSRRGNELDVKVDVCFDVVEIKNKQIFYISEASCGEQRIKKTTALSVHIGKKGEDLWETAKSLCCTPEQVLEQNDGVEFPLNGGEKIVLYRNL